MIHLDTTFLVDAIREGRRGEEGSARRWLAENAREELELSVFVLAELLVGAELHADPMQERRRALQACGGLSVVAPDKRLAPTYARVHAGLVQQGNPIATMDLLIGCTALNADAAVLTANRSHFSRIVGLHVIGY